MANSTADVWVVHTLPITTTANLAGKSLITAAGAAVASAANSVFGVIAKDTKSGDIATVKIAPSIVEVLATGTVTKGSKVEVLTATVVANIDGVSTNTTSAGVQNLAAGYPIGKALTGGVANETVLVSLFLNDAKTS
jgi:hypothetical protein